MRNVKQKVGVIVQARMNSERLPGKVMLDILGEPVLQHIINRLKECKSPDAVVVATTDGKKDDVIAGLAGINNLSCYRGSENDLLSRYYCAAKENKINIVIRITADCPLIEPGVIDDMVASYLKSDGVDYLSNTIKRTFPRGLDVEIFSFAALEKAFNSADKDYQREHVTAYIYEHPKDFMVSNFENSEDLSRFRLTLDTREDYILIKKIYEDLFPLNSKFGLKAVVDYLTGHPELLEINAHVEQKKLCK